jgi:hypothetical protein
MEKNYKYLGYFFIILIPLALLGFYKTYFGLIPNFSKDIHFWHHFHAFVASLWIVLLIVQPLLILNQKFETHRMLGKLSFYLFPVLIFSFFPLILSLIQRDELKRLLLPIATMSLLIIFYTLAIRNRKFQAKHMRYMISLAVVFIDPTVGRIVVLLFGGSPLLAGTVSFVTIDTILLSLIFLDRAKNLDYKPYVVSLIGFLVYEISFYAIFL